MSGCGLEKDGRTSTCAACGRGRPRGAASVSRRRGPRPRRRAPPPVIRACARRRSASGRARGRRGSSSSCDIRRVSSTAWGCQCLLGLPLSTGATRRGRTLRGLLAEATLPALRRSGPIWAASQALSRALSRRRCRGKTPPIFKARAPTDESKRRSPRTSPRAPRQRMRPARERTGGREKPHDVKSTTQILSPPSPRNAP